MWFYDAAGNRIRDNEVDVRVTKGVFYASIASHGHHSSRVTVADTFQIKFHFKAERDPSESNDSIKTARELEFDKPFDVQLEPRMDVDFFKFTAPSNGVVNWSWSGELVGHR